MFVWGEEPQGREARDQLYDRVVRRLAVVLKRGILPDGSLDTDLPAWNYTKLVEQHFGQVIPAEDVLPGKLWGLARIVLWSKFPPPMPPRKATKKRAPRKVKMVPGTANKMAGQKAPGKAPKMAAKKQ